jgi:uncharacterized RDD family membrane protein YckC
MTKWYYRHEAGTGGPVEDDELRRLAASGRLRPDSPVTPAGAASWFTAADYERQLGLVFGPSGAEGGCDDDRAAIVEAAFGPTLAAATDARPASSANEPGTPRPGAYWRRSVAFLIDLVVYAVPTALLCVLIGGVTATEEGARTDYRIEGRAIVVATVVAFGYFGLLTGRRGRAVGKAVTGLRVVDVHDGGPIGVVRGVGRFVAAVGLFILCIVPAVVDAAWALVDRERQTLHDKLVDSLVVQTPHPSSGRGRSETQPNSASPSPSS